MKLTPEQIEQNGEAVKAWMRGEPVEFRGHETGSWKTTWHPVMNNPEWNFRDGCYRPAPKPAPPVYVPFTRETIPMPCVVKDKNTSNRMLVAGVSEMGVTLMYSNGAVFKEFVRLLKEFTMDDGTPAGTLKE